MKPRPDAVNRLLAAKEAILAQPKFYDQCSIGSVDHPCESACCVAGWIVFQDNPCKYARLVVNGGVLGEADRLLGSIYTGGLFGTGATWPEPFRSQLENARTDKQRAKAAAGMIDHFIATGEA